MARGHIFFGEVPILLLQPLVDSSCPLPGLGGVGGAGVGRAVSQPPGGPCTGGLELGCADHGVTDGHSGGGSHLQAHIGAASLKEVTSSHPVGHGHSLALGRAS